MRHNKHVLTVWSLGSHDKCDGNVEYFNRSIWSEYPEQRARRVFDISSAEFVTCYYHDKRTHMHVNYLNNNKCSNEAVLQDSLGGIMCNFNAHLLEFISVMFLG